MPATNRRRAPRRPVHRAQPKIELTIEPALARFLTENLLEARRGSRLPTNLAGPDEDVNAYLALRLAQLDRVATDPRVVGGLAALVPGAPAGAGRRERADWYRANADHRLLCLGLFDRGDAVSRRDVPWGLTRGQSRERDMAIAAACYAAAADLLARGPGGESAGAVVVLRKLAAGCDDYVHVVGQLAVRRLGLGARLDERELSRLLPSRGNADRAAVAAVLQAVPADAADLVLDLWLEYRRTGACALRQRAERMAAAAGWDWPRTSPAT